MLLYLSPMYYVILKLIKCYNFTNIWLKNSICLNSKTANYGVWDKCNYIIYNIKWWFNILAALEFSLSLIKTSIFSIKNKKYNFTLEYLCIQWKLVHINLNIFSQKAKSRLLRPIWSLITLEKLGKCSKSWTSQKVDEECT